MEKQAVILANGEFPKSKHLLDLLTNADFLICCDGAINSLMSIELVPNLIIGDLDSIDDGLKTRFADRIIHIPNQDTNDLTKAAEWARDNGFGRIKILGATGKRDDHSIANIFLLRRYLPWFETLEMLSDLGIWRPINSTTLFQSFLGQQVSIFSSASPKPLFSENLKYPLNGLVINELYMGTLNESLGDTFTLSFEEGEYIVFQTYHPK